MNMKIVPIIILALSACTVSAQSLQMSLRAEQTVKGSAFETGLSYEAKNRFVIGAFFQTKGLLPSQEDKISKDPFYGMLCTVPFFSARHISLGGTIRAGLINEHFFTIVPSIDTKITVYRNTSVQVGSGYRHGYPSMSLGLVQKIYSSKKIRS
jgi:hypothetical protein